MQCLDVGFPVSVMHAHAISVGLTLPGFLIGQHQVVNAYYPFIKVAFSFHDALLHVWDSSPSRYQNP